MYDLETLALLYHPIVRSAVDALLHLPTLICCRLEYFQVLAGLCILSDTCQPDLAVFFRQKHSRTLLADSLQYRHRVPKVATMEHGKGQLDEAEVAGAVSHALVARLACPCLVLLLLRLAKTWVKRTTPDWSGAIPRIERKGLGDGYL